MFLTLDHQTFENTKAPEKDDAHSNKVEQKTNFRAEGKTVKFLGAKSKSVGGCATCRKRKKKCDEVHPSCGFCTRRKIECVWPPPRPRKKYERRNKVEKPAPKEKITEVVEKQPVATPTAEVTPIGDFISLEENASPFNFMSGVLSLTEMNTKPSILDSVFSYDGRDEETEEPATSMIPSKSPKVLSYDDEAFKKFELSPAWRESLDKNSKVLADILSNFSSSKESWLPDKIELILEHQLTGFSTKNHFESFIDRCLNPSPLNFYSTSFEVKSAFKHMELLLSDKGFKFLEYYIFHYSNSITICPADSNYFVKTFLPLAYTSEPILYALVSWGCLMYHSQDEARVYLHKATLLMYKTIERKSTEDLNFSDYQHFKEICSFFLILIGWEICSGDTSNWYHLLAQCKELIVNYGGLQKISENFNNSNDIKWLISNFQFHDLFASRSLESGTFFTMGEYESVLEEEASYGIDPIQGLLRPLNTILGEICNCSSRMKNVWKTLEEQSSNDEIDSRTYNLRRLAFYEKCESLASHFEAKIVSCRPSEKLLELVKDESSVERHLTLFELYSYMCMFYVGIYIRQLPPKSMKLQMLLLQSMELIDILIDTAMVVSLPLPLLISGQTCCMAKDRSDMIKRLQTVTKNYHVGNFARIVEIIKESWELNPDGSKNLDWSEISHSKNWSLYVG